MLIDEKGRLFGKINVIDFLAVLFIVIIIPMFFVAGKIINAEKPEVVKKESVVTTEVKFTQIMSELAKVLKEGDLERDEKGKPIGKLVKIISDKPIFIAGENQPDINSDSGSRNIKALFDLNCVEDRRSPVYRGHIIKIGNPIIFSTDLYSIQGIITGVRR